MFLTVLHDLCLHAAIQFSVSTMFDIICTSNQSLLCLMLALFWSSFRNLNVTERPVSHPPTTSLWAAPGRTVNTQHQGLMIVLLCLLLVWSGFQEPETTPGEPPTHLSSHRAAPYGRGTSLWLGTRATSILCFLCLICFWLYLLSLGQVPLPEKSSVRPYHRLV